MKKTLLFISLVASSFSFAQVCCNVVDSNGETVITKNQVCVSTTEAIPNCLDQDGDGVIDANDECPTIAGTVYGCPDSDNDGIIDSKDDCPNTAGKINGCPDSDGDGIIDIKDECPKIAGTINGCPDSDNDGVIDSKDNCPKVAGKINGCPDSDNDGVIDSKDHCPKVAGTDNGCPELTKEAKATLGKYAKTIQFNSGKSTFKSGVTKTLDNVAKVMNEFEDVHFEIDGYTDNTGNEAKNLKLSQDRAQAVVDYLSSHGIDSSRLISKGFGIANPIATNKTAAGRAQNRRVEIVAKH